MGTGHRVPAQHRQSCVSSPPAVPGSFAGPYPAAARLRKDANIPGAALPGTHANVPLRRLQAGLLSGPPESGAVIPAVSGLCADKRQLVHILRTALEVVFSLISSPGWGWLKGGNDNFTLEANGEHLTVKYGFCAG